MAPGTALMPWDLWKRSGLRLLRCRHSCHFAVKDDPKAGGSAFGCMEPGQVLSAAALLASVQLHTHNEQQTATVIVQCCWALSYRLEIV